MPGPNQIVELIRRKFQKSLSKSESITLSILLHFSIVAAIGALAVTETVTKPELNKRQKLVFELVSETKLKFNNRATSTAVNPDRKGTNSNKKDVTSGSRKASGVDWSESKKLVAETVKVQKQAVMMASLTSLSEMREAFNFTIHQITADSTGAFTPIQGNAPDTQILANGLGEGLSLGEKIRAGIAGGGGYCPPAH